MRHLFRALPVLLLVGFVSPAFGQAADTKSEEKKKQPHIRFICVSTIVENQEVILASRDDEENWLEHGTVSLRSAFITDWIPARPGELHLTLREGGTLKSISRFTYPAATRRAIAVLIADPQKKIYAVNIFDPEKMGLAKGSVLVANFSPQPGVVVLGSKNVTVQPGQRTVAKPTVEENGMYRMMVAHLDAEKKPVPCYDRYISANPDARGMLFLFPDAQAGLKVFNLPMFGELD